MTYNQTVNKTLRALTLIILLFINNSSFANNGYKVWLQYNHINDDNLRQNYTSQLQSLQLYGNSKTINVIENELNIALKSLLNINLDKNSDKRGLIIGTISTLNSNILSKLKKEEKQLKKDGFIIKQIEINNKKQIIITAKTKIGVLYGTFNFLRQLQMHQPLENINIVNSPKVDVRMLNHWDNLDRTVERGYSGFSIWDWHRLPDYLDTRYTDYARANASIGINGTALTNVNSDALILTPHYIKKVKALADLFRPYGIKVYLTARFSAPIELGNLETADPLDKKVAQWWKDKTSEIYKEIPDFGGFLVKANSEGQPGPQNYGRNHVDGANMLADAVKPFNGIVMWRAFVYSEHNPEDRVKQAYSEFVPYDGKFRDNVLIQVKNGAIDFQPREPFHPMFGAMPKTNLMMEFQITQEYMGQGTHLVYQPKLFEEVLEADTYREGKGSTVAKVIDGSLHNKKITGIAGVANIGTDINWTGHHFLQANWYGFGRMAWNPHLKSSDIAEEWIRMTFSNQDDFVKPIKKMMLSSRETVVNYMTPYGLHHIMATGHHYGPGPWVGNLSRPEWNPVYYHKADEIGIGFNRTKTGSNATSQYAPQVEKMYNNVKTTPERDLLWFHHVPWDYKLKNGESLWNGLALKYQAGVEEVKEMKSTWASLKKYVDPQRFKEISMMLDIQLQEAKWWRDSCLLYFQQFSQEPLPTTIKKPTKTLEHFQSLRFPFVPGN